MSYYMVPKLRCCHSNDANFHTVQPRHNGEPHLLSCTFPSLLCITGAHTLYETSVHSNCSTNAPFTYRLALILIFQSHKTTFPRPLVMRQAPPSSGLQHFEVGEQIEVGETSKLHSIAEHSLFFQAQREKVLQFQATELEFVHSGKRRARHTSPTISSCTQLAKARAAVSRSMLLIVDLSINHGASADTFEYPT